MLQRNGKNVRRGAVLVMAMVLSFAAAPAWATITVGSGIFAEEFNSTALDSNKWDVTLGKSGAITLDGSTANFTTAASDTAYIDSKGSLDFSSSPSEWAAEVKFQVNGTYSSWGARNYVLLDGLTTATTSEWTNQGFDLRLIRQDSSHFTLGWNGWDNDNDGRIATVLATDFDDGVLHVAQVHRKTDGTVDIYMDGTLISNQALLNGVNPTKFRIGDVTGYVEGDIVLDYVRVGAVPEPSSILLTVVACVSLVAYAWRKRR